MHDTNLNTWGCKMTYWENGADELALYALSDLTKQYTVVITRTKPWSTVHPDVQISDIYQLLDMCSVKLLYSGGSKIRQTSTPTIQLRSPNNGQFTSVSGN